MRPEGSPFPIPAVSLHHVGIAVTNVSAAAEAYVRRYGYSVRTPVIHDPVQTAYVQFLHLAGAPTYLELVMPDGPQSKLQKAIREGGGLNHLCYAVQDIDSACRRLRGEGMLLFCPPVPAAAFNGRPIAWLVGADKLLVELVERGRFDEL